MAGNLTHPHQEDGGPAREREMAALAARQYGVVGRSQLIALGFGRRAVERRLRDGRLHQLHRGVYAVGHQRVTQLGHWLAAVLACGEEALLSHGSAAALWGLQRARSPVDVTCARGHPGRRGIRLHRAQLHPEERAIRNDIPITSLPRTLFDLAEIVEERRLERAFEEADRLNLLEMPALERVCERGHGRRALRPIRRLLVEARAATTTRSPLEDRFLAFCHTRNFPPPSTNVLILDREVDALWPGAHLIVELDGFAFHHHRAAFERDRARDAALQAAGFRIIRVTHRRLDIDGDSLAAEIRLLLASPG